MCAAAAKPRFRVEVEEVEAEEKYSHLLLLSTGESHKTHVFVVLRVSLLGTRNGFPKLLGEDLVSAAPVQPYI